MRNVGLLFCPMFPLCSSYTPRSSGPLCLTDAQVRRISWDFVGSAGLGMFVASTTSSPAGQLVTSHAKRLCRLIIFKPAWAIMAELLPRWPVSMMEDDVSASLRLTFRTLAYNNAWANHRLLKACAGLPQAEFEATRTSFFP